MGRLQAEEFRRWIGNEDALRWHLQYNHYPPVSLIFLDSAKEAIQAANEERWDDAVTLPTGRSIKVHRIVQELHLDAFLGDDLDGPFTDETDELPDGDPIIG